MIRLRELGWLIVLGVSAFAALIFVSGVILGGPLDPPGPPAPTMKTLQEVEPRTPISALPFTITTSGSYYVTGNLAGVAASHGITISASNVTLDLRGYTLTGVGGSLDGIHINGSVATPLANVMIMNGAVDGWGDDGVAANIFGEDPGGGLCCLASAVTVDNMRALNSVGDGINLGVYSIVRNSIASGNDDDGIETSVRGRIEGNSAFFNTGDGIVGTDGTVIIGNTSKGNGAGGVGAGIADFGGGDMHIEGNNVIGNDTGIAIASAGNVIIKNTAATNTADYTIGAGNTVGPIETAATPLTNPWANIAY